MTNGFFKRLMEILETEVQTWWAEKTNTSQSTVSNYWFKGKYPRADKILKILELKKISANWLFFNIGPKSLEYLDAEAIDRVQNESRKTQIEIMELMQENMRLKELLAKSEIVIKENKLISGIKDFEERLGSENISNTIISSISFVKMLTDIVLKMAERYSRDNLDDECYNKILKWIESNFESQKFSAASKLKELDNLIK
jgi:transcriptional regulator with XRE-family HTH domain